MAKRREPVVHYDSGAWKAPCGVEPRAGMSSKRRSDVSCARCLKAMATPAAKAYFAQQDRLWGKK